MTTTKSENPTQENKGENKMKSSPDNKEESPEPSKKNKQQLQPISNLQRSIPFIPSKLASTPTLQDSLNLSLSDGDLQIVVNDHSHSSSISDGNIKTVKTKEEPVKTPITTTTRVTITTDMDVEDMERSLTDGVSKIEGKTWYIVLLALRIAAFVFCKIAFAVLAADQRKKVSSRESSTNTLYGYYTDSYDESEELHWYNYREFKYCLSVNVIGFVYSGLQICDLVKYFVTKRHTLNPKLRGYLNFVMDQALAYLLMSASSSAATVVYYWTIATSTDKYVEMANASVALSFLAVVAFASSSIVSAFFFCRFN